MVSVKKNILLTGSHRSGSTWTGQTIAANGEVLYIQEPFNVFNKKYHKTPIKYWFEYVSEEDSEEQQSKFREYLNRFTKFDLTRLREDSKNHSVSQYPRLVYGALRKNSFKRRLFKDPLALFSAEWLQQNMDMEVVIIIRHPAAFAESLKTKNWKHDFTHFIRQEKLMKGHLQPFEEEIKQFLQDEKRQDDIIEHASLLWNIFHHQIKYYQEKYPNWIFVRHEDLSRRPLTAFENLFKQLNLSFNRQVKAYLQKSTQATQESKLQRNSSDNVLKWKRNLSQDEQERIYQQTSRIAASFYAENEW